MECAFLHNKMYYSVLKTFRVKLCHFQPGMRKLKARSYCQNSGSEALSENQILPCNIQNQSERKSLMIEKLKNGPSLGEFIKQSIDKELPNLFQRPILEEVRHPYVKPEDINGNGSKVYFEVFGCQMNVNDTEIAWSVLKNHGYERAKEAIEADVVLVMTCSIREGAEQKVWNLLHQLKSLKKRRAGWNTKPLKIGVLGCMAERLKKKLFEREKAVSVIAGPDSYRDLPRLLATSTDDQASVNVLLSLDETYADVMPVRLNEESKSAYVSIMRGCDNMCSYCIVPFTRGRERSRPVKSIVDEIKYLSDQGYKEVILLGQNVNSYQDKSEGEKNTVTKLSTGFKTIYRPKIGGLRFSDLLDKVSEINPEMRIRFTSPHPKDFPDDVLYLIKERPNICKQIHLPAQSGNNRILELMRRGYTREAYLDLVNRIRAIIPNVALTSDFICGFVDETEEEFCDTLTLMQEVKYTFAYIFPFSMRERTRAHYHLSDAIPHQVKLDRLDRMSTVFRENAKILNMEKISSKQLVLIEGFSKRSNEYLSGRNDQNTKVILPLGEIPIGEKSTTCKPIEPGDYVTVHINDAGSQVLKGIPLFHSTIGEFNRLYHLP